MDMFLEKMADVLEVEPVSISESTKFRGIEGWSSLVGFSMLITIEEDYGVKVPVDTFLKCNTLGELYSKVAKSK